MRFFVVLCVFCTAGLGRAVRERKYYDLLGVSPDADDVTLKKAYKRQAMQWHPDRNPSNQEEASQKFMQIGEAYEVLSDPEKRAQYDRFGEAAFQQGGGGKGGSRSSFHFRNAERVFEWVFGDEPGGNSGFHFSFDRGSGDFGSGFNRRPQKEEFYRDDPYVKVLTDQNFDEDAVGWVRLVEFYAPWCGHCKTLSAKWSALGKALQSIVKVSAVNCDDHGELCQRHGVHGYPTLKAFVSGTPLEDEYHGDRSLKSLQTWAVSHIPNRVTSITMGQELEDFLGRCRSKGRDRASWKVCVLLFTERTTTSALYKSLSHMYDGKIAFGQIHQGDAALGAMFNVDAYPSLVAVCNGDVRSTEPFVKKMQPERIRTFLNAFASGRKCNRAVHIDSAADVDALSAAQLKEILSEHGVLCEACFEKPDYVKRVKEIYSN